MILWQGLSEFFFCLGAFTFHDHSSYWKKHMVGSINYQKGKFSKVRVWSKPKIQNSSYTKQLNNFCNWVAW